MKTLKQLCKPRSSVFDDSKQDVVLNLSDLIQNRIDPDRFFAENYLTEGMKRLLREAFKRFDGKSPQGILALRQAMGGGKTHNMIALGLLAKYPHLRKQVMGDLYQSSALNEVKVVAFTGRESDVPFGIWGSIAEQLNKSNLFTRFYAPLRAPGETSWIDLLQGDPLLILLDELPFYLENAQSVTVGNSNLSQVTQFALSSLFTAIGRAELSNVCLVMSNLEGAYEGESQRLDNMLNFKQEAGRASITLEPIQLNTDEFYHILRKRLFETLPDEQEILEVAHGYVEALREAKQMNLIHLSPDQFAAQVRDAYPFHFAIRDLYARFRENPGFQQTRGLIRLMRTIVAKLFEESTGKADKLFLIHAHDLDMNDPSTLEEIARINDKFSNAISHDIASNGYAEAERMDAYRGGTDAQDVCKLLLVASLANVPNPLLGLSQSEIISYLCAPKRDVSKLPGEIIDVLPMHAWYVYSSMDGRYYFRDVKNLAAKLSSLAEGYNREAALKELRTFLTEIFLPVEKDCYQDVIALPAIDSIHIVPEKITLIIYEPHVKDLHPDLDDFYKDLTYQNRVLFLSGTHGNLENVITGAAKLKAINQILLDQKSEQLPSTDLQRIEAEKMYEGIKFGLLSTLREVFTTLIYPFNNQLMSSYLKRNFNDNAHRGEHQIRETLKDSQKFTEDTSSDIFRLKCEQRLFKQQRELPWSEVKRRSATDTRWQWHRANALDKLKNELVRKDLWREHGNSIEIPPFPPAVTQIIVQDTYYDKATGEATLKITPIHGDSIHYAAGTVATIDSPILTEFRNFKTTEATLSFLCVDSTGVHQTGKPCAWRNKIIIKHGISQKGNEKVVALSVVPPMPIFYTTDGSDPKTYGQNYVKPFSISPSVTRVLVVAKNAEVYSQPESIEISWDIANHVYVNPVTPVTWKRRFEQQTTQEVYDFLLSMKKHNATVLYPRIMISGKHWVEFTCDQELLLDVEALERTIENLRALLPDNDLTVTLGIDQLKFPSGQHLLNAVSDIKTELRPGEVSQE